MGKLFEIRNTNSGSFSIQNKTQTHAEIVIYSAIGDSPWDEDMIGARAFDKKIKELPETVNQIDVRLNSPGGDVFAGVAIYNRLKQHKAKVTIYVDGLAASIASIIMLAGDEIVFGEGALMMIHKPWTFAMGDSNDLQNTIDRLDDIEEQLINIYRRKTGIDRSEIQAMLSEETWLDANQALDMGFIDRTMEDDETLDVAACLNNAKWVNKRPTLRDNKSAIDNKINDFSKKIENLLAR